MLSLYIEAPFAVCRTFTAGWYRPTATFLAPSTIYGLLLNLAGIETRLREEDADHPGTTPASLTRRGLPRLRMALGVPAAPQRQPDALESSQPVPYPKVQTIYQQLHNYPVGTSGRDRADAAFGNKYNITPVRRELLCNVRAVVVVNGNADVEELVRRTLQQGAFSPRYGLPFLGDNAFLPDRIETHDVVPRAYWYERLTAEEVKLRPRTTRLTIWIDRADSSRTVSDLFAPTAEPATEIPSAAWVEFSPPSLS